MQRAPHLVVLTATALLALALPAGAAPTVAAAPPIATGELSGTHLTVSPKILFESAILRVSGPAGYEAVAWSQGEPFGVDLLAAGFIPPSDGMPGVRPLALPDGRYGFEVVFYLESGQRRAFDGAFFVENGTAWSPAPPGAERAEEAKNVSAKEGSTGEHFLIGDTDNDGEANLQIRANNSDGTIINYWGVRNQSGDLRASTSIGGSWVDRFTVEPAGQVGIGTTVPQADLHIYRPGGNIRITDSDACPNANAAWEMEEDFGRLKFEVVPNCPGDLAGGKVWFHGTGDVGLGTADPADSLHIYRPFPAIRLTDSDPCPISAASWQINQAFGKLRFAVVSKCLGDPTGTKMSITGSGRLGVGTDGPLATLHVNGDGIIEGDVAFGSSRTIKHEIEPVDGEDMLAAVRELPLYHWKYREDDVQALHVGPMAEDVHAAFGLGRDEKHLSPADSAGLALAAVQGLDQRLDGEVAELRADNAELAARNQELLERLAALEARLGEVLERESRR